MRDDINGCSTSKIGQENYEYFDTRRGAMCQYGYRAENGKLFSCIAKTVDSCRDKRDEWILKQKKAE